MLTFNWDKTLELGIEIIDQQHKNIINRANTFFISYKAGNPNQRLNECLTFLDQYVMYHFQAEEAFQVDCGYPEYRPHQAQHTGMKMQLKFHVTQLQASGFSQACIDAFYSFLRDWIVEHILTEDRKFAAFFCAQESGGRAEPPE